MKKYFYLLILSILFFAQSSYGISPYLAVSSIPISQKETASGVAPLTSSSKIVQNSANPPATPAASKIPIADANGKLDAGIGMGGSWVEANSYGSINAAVVAIGSTPTTLIVSSARLLTASLTIPQTLTLKILEGGSIVQTSTYTLTINGPFEGGLCRVFSGFSPGGVVFGNASVKEISPIWFGAYADGTHATATTSAINQAASAGRTHAIPIRFSGNSYAVNDSLNFTISGKEGWRVKGDGPNTTVITGTLTGAYPVFDCAGSQSMQVEDLRILGGATGSQSCGLLIARSPDAPFGNRGDCCSIKRVEIDGTFSKAGLANSSADQSVLDGCYIVGPVGVVISPTDYLGVGSKYVSLSPTSTGCTYNVIRDCIGIIGTARACVLFNDGAALNCYGTYFAAYAGNPSYFELTGANFKSVKLYGCRGENSGSNDPLYILNMTGGATSQGGFLEGEFDSSANGAIIHGQITSYFVNIYLHSLLGSLVQGTAAYSVLYNVQNLPSTLTKSVQNIVMGGGSQRTEWMAGNNLFFCGDNNLYEGSVVTWRKLGLGAGKTAKAPTGVIYNDIYAGSTTAAGGEMTLSTYSIPANVIPNPGTSPNITTLRVTMFGYTARNTNTKTVRMYFGGTKMTQNYNTPTPNGVDFKYEMIARYRGSGNRWDVVSNGQMQSTVDQVYRALVTASVTSPIEIKVTGQAAGADGDITLSGMTIEAY